MADLQRKTANLFDLTTNMTSYSCSVSIDNNGNVKQTNSGSYARSEWTFENLEANKYYTLKVKYSNPNSNSVRLNILNSNAQTIITSDVGTDTSGDLSVTFQAQGGNTFIRLYSNTLSTVTFTAVVFSDIMLNEGTTALPYEPYSSTGWYHSLRKQCTATETVQTGDTIYADGTAITSYTIKGNTVQNGTPTQSNPVEVQGVGVRTGNLFNGTLEQGGLNGGDGSEFDSDYRVRSSRIQLDGGTYTISCTSSNIIGVFIYNGTTFEQFIGYNASPLTFTLSGTRYVRIGFSTTSGNIPISPNSISNAMLNTGSTAKPYEPYGYKIPISNGQQTTNIYLGSTQTVRQIKKLVLDGTENWNENLTNYGYRFGLNVSDSMQSDTTDVRSLCTHLPLTVRGGTGLDVQNVYVISASNDLIIKLSNSDRVSDLKSWLAQQYANGTPVTVWYVLATPQTATVNEPLMKIGNYVDTLSNATAIPTTEGANSITVDTTVQPSEFTATWTGWHDASVKEKSENLFDVSTANIGVAWNGIKED